MPEHRNLRTWIFAAGAIALIAGHGAILYFAWSHLGLSVVAVSAVLILALRKHRGWIGRLHALFRRRDRQHCSACS